MTWNLATNDAAIRVQERFKNLIVVHVHFTSRLRIYFGGCAFSGIVLLNGEKNGALGCALYVPRRL